MHDQGVPFAGPPDGDGGVVSAGVLPSGPPVPGLRPRRQHVKYHRPDPVGEDGNRKGRRSSGVDGTGGKVSWKKRRGDDRWWGYRKTRPDTVRGRAHAPAARLRTDKASAPAWGDGPTGRTSWSRRTPARVRKGLQRDRDGPPGAQTAGGRVDDAACGRMTYARGSILRRVTGVPRRTVPDSKRTSGRPDRVPPAGGHGADVPDRFVGVLYPPPPLGCERDVLHHHLDFSAARWWQTRLPRRFSHVIGRIDIPDRADRVQEGHVDQAAGPSWRAFRTTASRPWACRPPPGCRGPCR